MDPSASTSLATPHSTPLLVPLPNVVTRRYFLRLSEALADRFPDVAAPKAPDASTLDDFFLAVRSITTNQDLPGLGFEFGSRIAISDYGVVGLAIASARNLAEAIEIQLKYLDIITNTAKVHYVVSRTEQHLILKLRELGQGRRLDRFTIESELSAQMRFVMDLLPAANMAQCELSFPFEPLPNGQPYQRAGSCEIRFEQPTAQLRMPVEWAERALDSADETLAPMLEDRCQLILSQLTSADDWVQKVRNLLLTKASEANSLVESAEALGVSVAKLRWQLGKSKTSYKQILLDVRMTLACQYLEETPLTLQQVSYQLGYHYPSNFQLAFKKYFNCAPGEWRRTRR
tara:strand:- start:6834 stop:7868 length:1035 start_codon:yes stop_codon:yes gene_type:complete